MKLHQLYRHYNKAGDLLYVGRSLNAIARLVSHCGSPWFHEIAFIEIENFATAGEAHLAEARAIINEHPAYNRVIPNVLGPNRNRTMGRPRIGEKRDQPWKGSGLSERTWYRRQKEKAGNPQKEQKHD